MPKRTFPALFSLALTAVACLPTPTSATVQSIIHTDQPLPDAAGDFVGPYPIWAADLSRDGKVAVTVAARPADPDAPNDGTDQALLLWSNGTLTTLLHSLPAAATNQAMPVDAPAFSPDGRFLASPVLTPFNSAEDYARANAYLWNFNTPSAPPTTSFDPTDPAIDHAYLGDLSVTNSQSVSFSLNQSGSMSLYTGPASHPQLLAAAGSPLPGGATIASGRLWSIATNAPGRSLFVAPTDETTVYAQTDSNGIYLGTPGNVRSVAARNDPAPGIPNAWFAEIEVPANLDNADRTSFLATTVGPGVTTTTDQGIWVGSPGSLTLLARQGSLAPVAARPFRSLSRPTITSAGQIAFTASLGSTTTFGDYIDDSLWVTDPADPTHLFPVAIIGDDAPGTDCSFQHLSDFSLGETGLIAFDASVFSPTQGYLNGLWLGRPGDLHLLLLQNDPITVDGQSALVDSIYLAGSPAVTDDGRVLVHIDYHSPDSFLMGNGIFLVSLPEPATLAPLSLAFLLSLIRLPARR